MLSAAGDLNQFLTAYCLANGIGETAEITSEDRMKRSFLDLIIHASSSEQALKYAQAALHRAPDLRPIIEDWFEFSHPTLIKALTNSSSDAQVEAPAAGAKVGAHRRAPLRAAASGEHPSGEESAVRARHVVPLQPQRAADQKSAGDDWRQRLAAQREANAYARYRASADARKAETQLHPATPRMKADEYYAMLQKPLYTPPPVIPRIKVKVDPELGRLAVALHCASPLRVWLLARETAANGSGWITLDELRTKIEEQRVDIGKRQLRRLIAQGQGMFWRIDRTTERLYLVGIVQLAASLTQAADQLNPDLVNSNLPGMLRQVYVTLEGSLAEFEARLYAAWFTVKNAPIIARDTLTMLFNRDKRTLRRWEAPLKPLPDRVKSRHDTGPRLEVIKVYAQSAHPEDVKPRPGDHDLVPTRSYNVRVYDTEQVTGARTYRREQRVSWSLPNRYRSHHLEEHRPAGQGRSVLRASAYAAGLQPPQVKTLFRQRGIHRNPRRYFEQPKRLRSLARKYGAVAHTRYLWIGASKSGAHIYEPNDSGKPETFLDEKPIIARGRLGYHERRKYKQHRRAYLDWFAGEKQWATLEQIASTTRNRVVGEGDTALLTVD